MDLALTNDHIAKLASAIKRSVSVSVSLEDRAISICTIRSSSSDYKISVLELFLLFYLF